MTTRHRNQTIPGRMGYLRKQIRKLKSRLKIAATFEKFDIEKTLTAYEQFYSWLDDIRIDQERVIEMRAKKMLNKMLAKLK